MGIKEDIKSKVKNIIDTNYVVEDVSYVPSIDNSKLTFGNKGLKFEATVLFIDMRGSTDVLNKHNKSTVAKIHMAYFHAIIKIANLYDGQVRSFNGDSMLAFFQGTTKNTLSNAVKAAMKIKYILNDGDEGINKILNKYTPVDFGIGIDDGKILCTKIGIGGDSNNKDLIWIGNAVNKSVVISDECKNPTHIGISSFVYNNLNDEVKYYLEKDLWGNDVKVDMWEKAHIDYNGSMEVIYTTSYYWSL